MPELLNHNHRRESAAEVPFGVLIGELARAFCPAGHGHG